MPRRSNIQVSSLIAFFSILTIIVQFAAYYFFASFYVIWGASSLIILISCHILLEKSSTYESCFIYMILNVFVCLIITLLTYYVKDYSFTFIPYTGTLIGIIVINWLIPTLHCFLRYMFDYGSKIENFNSFYRNNSIVFLLFYVGIIAYGAFFTIAFPSAYQALSETANFTPFLIISTQIEDYLYKLIPLSDILVYLCSRILVFIPYGFYCALLTRNQSRLIKFCSLLIFPIAIEVIQYFIITNRCDIDDFIYAVIGGLLGSLLFYLTNLVFRLISGKDFLAKDAIYRFSNNTLHF